MQVGSSIALRGNPLIELAGRDQLRIRIAHVRFDARLLQSVGPAPTFERVQHNAWNDYQGTVLTAVDRCYFMSALRHIG